MDAIVSADDPTVSQAMEALSAWEAESAAGPTTTPAASEPAASANEPTAPATAENGQPNPQAKADEGTSATEDSTTQKPTNDQGKPTDSAAKDKTAANPPTSKFAKDQERRLNTWKELNAEKELVRTTAETLKQREAALAAREQKLSQREAKLSQPRFKPEDYEQHAGKLEAEAKKLEDEGNFTQADRKRYDAEKAREYAAQLRANPPKADPSEAEQAAQFKARQKEWWGKAAVDFPNVIKEGTPERTALIELLNKEPDIVNDPKGMYYASRLVSAETSAAHVPQLRKDLEAAQARIKELEQLTAVPGDGSVPATSSGPKAFKDMSSEEQLAQLEAEAKAMSSYV